MHGPPPPAELASQRRNTQVAVRLFLFCPGEESRRDERKRGTVAGRGILLGSWCRSCIDRCRCGRFHARLSQTDPEMPVSGIRLRPCPIPNQCLGEPNLRLAQQFAILWVPKPQ